MAGPMGHALAWVCAALLLASLGLAARVALAARGSRDGRVRAAIHVGLLVLAFGVGVGHFLGAPQQLQVSARGDWVVRNAYGLTLDVVPAEEIRQVRVVSDPRAEHQRVEVRLRDAGRLTLHGRGVTTRLGYHWSVCGAWQDRPVWGPHTFDLGGPVCDDRPWRTSGRPARAAR